MLTIYLPFSTFVTAAVPPTTNEVENIKLNIKDHEMAVTFIGLTNGEATLIQGPNGENILINTGGKNSGAELAGWLDLYNVKKLQTLIITNEPEDISVALQKLVAEYKVKQVISSVQLTTQIKEVLPKKIVVTAWKEGAVANILPEVTASVIFAGNQPEDGLDIMLNFFNHRIFLMSSYSKQAENAILAKRLENIHVFKLPTNPKENTISEGLIEYLNPQISILFAASKQPNKEVVYDLHNAWSEIYYTKKHGSITIKFTETKYEVITVPIIEE